MIIIYIIINVYNNIKLSIFNISNVKGNTNGSFLTTNCSFKAFFTQKSRVPNMHVLSICSGVTPILCYTFGDGMDS